MTDATRACLKIEKVPDFCPGRCGLTKKTASNTFVLRGFSTRKMAASDVRFAKSGKKTVFAIFQTSPSIET